MLTFCLSCLRPDCAASRWHFWTTHMSEKKSQIEKEKPHSVSFYYQGSSELLQLGMGHKQILWKGIAEAEQRHFSFSGEEGYSRDSSKTLHILSFLKKSDRETEKEYDFTQKYVSISYISS